MELRPGRRRLLSGAAATALAIAVPAGGRALARGTGTGTGTSGGEEGLADRLRALEQAHSARLGVFVHNSATGRTVAYRAGELFPMCSTFKTIAVAAVLRDLDHDGTFLAKRIRYASSDVTEAGYAPVTGLHGNLETGMTVGELCAAAIVFSDNAAVDLLLRELGGPSAVTRFCRSIGDRVTRLDRWEPALNSAEPDRITDTTTPQAIARTYACLTTGNALDAPDRRRLTTWLLNNTTGANRLRAGLPKDWTVAEKTGTGGYGTTNDVGIAWPSGRGPVTIAVLSTKHDPAAPADEPLLAGAAALIV
ncbi:class A beta-lactamase [Kitasatospora sp. NPDC057500]|uniref:class A beta-lactamase n=1 Tax=Kitasatospora sp. NPDC057500 TaxID=3346151 RepID=UPI0036CD13D0